jgi:N-acetylglucosamine kinase-like BadF-type ATPase
MIIGIDVGGTKTLIRAVDATGAERDLLVPTVQWLQGRALEHPLSVEQLFSVIAQIAPDADDAALVVGAHGCDTPDQVVAFRDALAARHAGPVQVTNDAALVGPAAGVDRAIGVIAGTGSIVIGADRDGNPITAGGHGWMIADPGSAPGIVREAVRAVIARADTGAAPELLGHTLMDHYGTDDPNELAWVFMAEAGIHRWAEAAPAVFAAADAGSAEAAATVERAGRDLAAQVAHVLGRGAVADAIVAAGGVVTNQPRLANAIERELGRLGIVQPFHVLGTAPVAGAVALGARLLESHGVPETSAHP